MDIFFQNVTLQLLTDTDRSSLRLSKNEEEDKSDDVKQREETHHQNEHVNGKREVKEDHVAELDFHQVSETQMDEEAMAEEETDTVTESKTQSQAEELTDTDLHPDLSTELKLQETAAVESEVHQEQAEHSVPETSAEEKATNKPADPDDDEPGESSPCEDGQEAVSERNAAVSSEVDKESVDDGEHVGEMNAASPKAFRPPANPPPPPSALQNSSGMDTR